MEEQLSLFTEGSTSSPVVRHVRMYLSRESGSECRREAEREAPSHSSSFGSSENFDPATSYGRTWLEYCPTNHSRSSSPRLQNAGIVLPTGLSTRSSSPAQTSPVTIFTARMPEWTAPEESRFPVQFRRDGGVCGSYVRALSDVLEPMSPTLLPYFLSTLACSGIIRRAGSRGKKLPRLLADALAYMIAWWSARETDSTHTKQGGVKTVNYDKAGTVVNGTCPGSHNAVIERRVSNFKADLAGGTEDTAAVIGEHDNRITDLTNVTVHEAVGVDFYNCATTDKTEKTLNCAATDKDHTGGVIVINSNGGDVMPSVTANEAKLGGDNQHNLGGGVCPLRKEGEDS